MTFTTPARLPIYNPLLSPPCSLRGLDLIVCKRERDLVQESGVVKWDPLSCPVKERVHARFAPNAQALLTGSGISKVQDPDLIATSPSITTGDDDILWRIEQARRQVTDTVCAWARAQSLAETRRCSGSATGPCANPDLTRTLRLDLVRGTIVKTGGGKNILSVEIVIKTMQNQLALAEGDQKSLESLYTNALQHKVPPRLIGILLALLELNRQPLVEPSPAIVEPALPQLDSALARPDIVSTPNSNIVAHNLSVLSHVRPTGSTTNGGGGLSEGVILGSGQVQHCEFSLDPAGRLVGAVRWVDHSLRDSTYSQGTATDTMVKASIVFWGYGGSAVILDYQTRGNLTHTQRANWGGTFAAQEAIRSAFIAENPYALEVINRTPQALLPEDIVDALHLGIEALSVYSFSKKWQQKERHLLLLNVGDQVRIIRVFAEGEIQTRARRVYLLGSGLKVLAGLRVVITKQTPHVYKDTPDPTPPLQLRLILPKGFTHYDLIMPIFELVQRKLVSTHLQVKGWESATSAYASNVQIEFTDDNLIPANHVDADGNYRSSPYRNSNGE